MSSAVRHLRTHWKKYTFGTLAFGLATRYFTKKFRENLVIREYCNRAKKYGEQRVGMFEPPRKIMVFLNPKANNTEAKIAFMKYAAPLLHLSGMDVTVVESEYQGQIRTLMAYIDPKTDAVVVAGGDGTVMEVVNGLLRRHDSHQIRRIPVGIIPLGKENRFYQSHLSSHLFTSPARTIGEATMDVLGGTTTPVHIMELQPENGRTLYAFSSIEWGVFKEAYENRDSFRLFGKLRLFFSYLSTAVKKWPLDYQLHLWLPARSLPLPDKNGSPPSEGDSTNWYHGNSTHDNHIETSTAVSSWLPGNRYHARCASHQQPTVEKDSSPGIRAYTATSLAQGVEGRLDHKYFDVIGFKLSLEQSLSSEDCLKLAVWPSSIQKTSFIKQGWSVGKSPPSLPSQNISTSEVILQPYSHQETWLSVDGEAYEAMPMAVRVLPNYINLSTHKNSGSVAMSQQQQQSINTPAL